MKILFDDLEEAFHNYGDESSFWVDKENGKVIFTGNEMVFGELEYDDPDEAEAVREIKILNGEIETNENIEIDENRYVEIIPPYSDEKWKWMEEFTVHQVEDIELHHKLANALRGRKPFRRFKDVLVYEPNVEQKWFDFEKDKFREYADIWAKSEGLEIDFAKRKK